jgi:hypothetical protein
MGQERECAMRYNGQSLSGKALLETDCLLFRGSARVRIPLQNLTRVVADSGVLRLEFAGGAADLELGEAAAKWAEKILHRPSLLDKLGVKPAAAVRLVGQFETSFEAELRARGAQAAPKRSTADLVFFAAEHTSDLDRLTELAKIITPDGSLWIVYPKGVKTIREVEVLQAGRAAGLKDTKVASFSPTHTALRFVVPLTSR